MSADIEFDHRDSLGIARLRGDVDITQAGALREQLLGAVRNDDLGLVVDLTDARYVDSVGVSLLFELAERLSGRQLRFAVVVPQEGLVERVLTIVDLQSVAEVHRDLNEALSGAPPQLAAQAESVDPSAHEREAERRDPQSQPAVLVVARRFRD